MENRQETVVADDGGQGRFDASSEHMGGVPTDGIPELVRDAFFFANLGQFVYHARLLTFQLDVFTHESKLETDYSKISVARFAARLRSIVGEFSTATRTLRSRLQDSKAGDPVEKVVEDVTALAKAMRTCFSVSPEQDDGDAWRQAYKSAESIVAMYDETIKRETATLEGVLADCEKRLEGLLRQAESGVSVPFETDGSTSSDHD